MTRRQGSLREKQGRILSDRGDQRLGPDDVHDAGQIVGQHRERHLGLHIFEALHQKVRRAHARLDRPERMLDGLAAQRDLVGVIVQPFLDAFQDVLVLPTSDAPLFSRGASVLDHAGLAGIRPIGS